MSKLSSFFKRYHIGSLVTAAVGGVGILQQNQQILTAISPKVGAYVTGSALVIAAFQQAALTVKQADK